tara:strand:- start:218 stop:823 length:606 start_codon:yes stop_codon:yes gene_type:complete
MLFSDTYKEITTNTKGIYKEKGSKFISYTFTVYNEKDIKNRIQEVKQNESGANHYCYAYILHPDQSIHRCNDDGEPNSTAGRPILKQIKANELTNILVIVVRYFGGIKLGIPGLIRSYGTSAMDAIKKSEIITKMILEKYAVLFEHEQMNDVMRIIKEYNLEIIQTDFQISCKLTFLVPKKKSNLVLKTFKNNHKIKIKYS